MALDTMIYARSFSGGEVTEEFHGRIDDVKYATGLARCRNGFVLPHGPVEKRPGLEFVRATKHGLAKPSRLLPFVFSPEDSAVIEMSEGVFRFFKDGAILLDPVLPIEVAHPYQSSELFEITYYQVNDIVVLCHRNHPPAELRRVSATSWTYSAITFGSPLSPPTGTSATVTPVGPPPPNPEPLSYSYVVTAIDADGAETGPSTPATVSVDFFQTNDFVTFSWSAVTGAVRYRVYRRQSGAYGYLGETSGTLLNDGGSVLPDFTRSPPNPISATLFDAAGKYPAAVGEFQQRVIFGGTINAPQTVWASKTGVRYDFNFSVPPLATDAFSFRIAAQQGSPIRHVVVQSEIVLLTGAGEWRVTGASTDAIAPDNLLARLQSSIGASFVTPVAADNVVVFSGARDGRPYQLGFSQERGGYIAADLTLRAPHLFDGHVVRDLARARVPFPVICAVSSSGLLLGLTYLPEEEVVAWHAHETEGSFESVAAVPEGGRDSLYVVVQRPFGRFIERMRRLPAQTQEEGVFVDCSLSYEGPPTSTFTGLGHLNGRKVAILADGSVHPPITVSGGSITLTHPASVVHVGLAYTFQMRELPAAMEAAGFGQGRPKSVSRAWVKLYRSGGVRVRADGREVELKTPAAEVFGDPPPLATGEYEAAIPSVWSLGGQVEIVQDVPLPATVLGITKEIAVGN